MCQAGSWASTQPCWAGQVLSSQGSCSAPSLLLTEGCSAPSAPRGVWDFTEQVLREVKLCPQWAEAVWIVLPVLDRWFFTLATRGVFAVLFLTAPQGLQHQLLVVTDGITLTNTWGSVEATLQHMAFDLGCPISLEVSSSEAVMDSWTKWGMLGGMGSMLRASLRVFRLCPRAFRTALYNLFFRNPHNKPVVFRFRFLYRKVSWGGSF